MRSLLFALAFVIAFVFSPVRSQILSSESTPTAYHLKIDASDLATSDTFWGAVLVNITVAGGGTTLPSSLVLHSEFLNLNASSLVVMGKLTYSLKWQVQAYSSFNINQTYLNVTFPSPLATGVYSIYIEYLGTYQTTMAGFAKVGYHFKNEQKYLGITGMEPIYARRVFPCYDSPAYKAQFTLEMTVSRPSVAISNVKPSNVYNVSDTNKRVFVFHNYPPMPVYQLGWAVLDQTSYSVRGDNSTSPVIHTRAPYLYFNQTTWANELTWKLVQAVGLYTGIQFNTTIPQSSSKIEQIVLPEFFTGTSEGYSFMSFSEESILVSPDKSSTRYIQDVGLTLTRGVVQQWFGDIISIDSWDNIWMMKGIDQFLQYVIADSLFEMSDWELEDQAVVELTQPALALDSPDSHPLTFHSGDETELVSTVSDSLTKYKGGAIIRMLKDILGSFFNNAMYMYIQTSYSSPEFNPSNPSVFWNMLYGMAADEGIDLDKKSLAEIMQQWTNTPGYPVLSVSKNSTHFNVSQSNSSQWWVPVTYFIQGSSNVNRSWLSPGSSFTVLAPSARWILLNVNQTGFYRVNYSADLSQEFTNQLSTDLTQLPRLSRAQLIDDAFALDSQMALGFTNFLRAETDYFPWTTALRHYQNLIYSMAGHSSYQLLQNYVLDLMNGVIAETGFSPKPQDTHIDKLKRALVLEKACEFGHQTCIQRAVTNLRAWMAQTYFDPDLSPALMCAGVANSSTEVWHSVWSMYHYSIFPSIRVALLRSLTCTYNVDLLYQFLNNITSTTKPVVSSKDKTILLQALASKPFGAHVLLDWLVDRLQAQVNSTSPETSTPLPQSSTSSSSTTPIPNTTSTDETANQQNVARLVTNPTSGTVAPTENLPESDVTTILAMILPRLTSIEDGTKLDSFLTLGDKTGLSNTTRETMMTATHKIYMQADEVMKLNGKMTTWLEAEATTSTPAAGSTKPTAQTQPPHTTQSPSGSRCLTSEATTFLVCLLALCLHIRTMV